jgi:hypothetical protein
MKDKDKFLKEMEKLKVPNADPSAQHQNSVKMAILSASRSAKIGVWLIALPCYFLLSVFVYYYSHAIPTGSRPCLTPSFVSAVAR